MCIDEPSMPAKTSILKKKINWSKQIRPIIIVVVFKPQWQVRWGIANLCLTLSIIRSGECSLMNDARLFLALLCWSSWGKSDWNVSIGMTLVCGEYFSDVSFNQQSKTISSLSEIWFQWKSNLFRKETSQAGTLFILNAIVRCCLFDRSKFDSFTDSLSSRGEGRRCHCSIN